MAAQNTWEKEHFGGNRMWKGEELLRAGRNMHKECRALWVMNCMEI